MLHTPSRNSTQMPPFYQLMVWELSTSHEVPRWEFGHAFRTDFLASPVRTCGRMILEAHTLHQGEGGEQGDPSMPLLFSLGQHSALEAVNSRLQEDDKLMAFLNDVCVANPRPDSVLHSYTAPEEELWTHAGIRINGGKTRVWNRSGSQPRGCDILQRIAIQSDPDAVVWRRHPDSATGHQDSWDTSWAPRLRAEPIGKGYR